MLRGRHTLFSLAFLSLLLMPLSAAAMTSFDFVSSGGQFSIANDTLSFGNGLTISAASDGGVDDAALVGTTILLGPVTLTGATVDLGNGLTGVGIDDSFDYVLEIYEAPADGGDLLLTANYDPGDFIVFGAAGILSGEIVDGLSNVVLTTEGMGFSPVLDALAATSLPIDFNATLSAAGQDIAERIRTGALVTGAVAGSVAIVPEPSTAVLLGLGLLGLTAAGGRISRGGD